VNIDQQACQREQRNTQQPDRCRSGKLSGRLGEPARLFELGDELSGEASQKDRYG